MIKNSLQYAKKRFRIRLENCIIFGSLEILKFVLFEFFVQNLVQNKLKQRKKGLSCWTKNFRV